MSMNFHPAAQLMPAMTDREFAALKESIRRSGQLVPIKILNGLVLDGRYRIQACFELDLVPIVEHLPPDTDAIEYVLDIHTRQDLTTDQQATIVQAAATMRHGGARRVTAAA